MSPPITEATPPAPTSAPPAPAPPPPPPRAADPDYFAALPKGAAQLAILCARKGQDTVSKAFCTPKTPPTLHGLSDLVALLGLSFKNPSAGNGTGGNPGFALTSHSSSLVLRAVSAANPRVIVFTPPPATGASSAYVALGFTRGEQLVELATFDPDEKAPAFYLLKYEQACNKGKGCSNKDLFTAATEHEWDSFTLYEDEDLQNTPVDCLRCHQPDAAKNPFLRMQEISAPFTHWFSAGTSGGRAVMADYHDVHGSKEGYGPIPAQLVDASDPSLFARFVQQNNGATPQPNAFDSAKIEAEILASSPNQPAINDPPGKSATWQGLFDVAAKGGAIRPPYHDVKITSPARLDAFAAAYRSGGDLPDPRDLLGDGAAKALGLVPRDGATGTEIVRQMCSECHSGKLDPTLSRARFDAMQLDKMSVSEKSLAIARMRLPASDPQHMPPAVFGTLSADQINAAAEALQ